MLWAYPFIICQIIRMIPHFDCLRREAHRTREGMKPHPSISGSSIYYKYTSHIDIILKFCYHNTIIFLVQRKIKVNPCQILGIESVNFARIAT
jgi:hypothetical protein